ncbi:hypothetical protein AK830_g9954 [Neonectria ditissima]|uniref:Cytochrome P450 n=1 Tax=Neonectria ditissima TaxID=78410 RepID=A0A0N8H5M7_9HYPO|nr:hypothetical protein AK830_g9954 [Neonectria ditissima]
MANLITIISPQSWPTSIYVVIALALALAFGGMATRPALPKTAPQLHRGLPLLGSLEFFLSRSTFLRTEKPQTKSGNFSFHYGPHTVVSLLGPGGKATFYGERGLDPTEGYKGLSNAGPNVKFLHSENSLVTFFLASVKRATQKDRLEASLPFLISDTHAALMDMSSAPHGILRPIDDMWQLIYRLTHRTLGSKDIADDPIALERTMAMYSSIEGSSAFEIMFPSLPTPTKVRKVWAGAQLHRTFSRIVEDRKKTGRREDDSMQVLIDQGASDMKISAFIMGSLFSGVLNTGVNASLILCFLAQERRWYARTQEQVDAVVTKNRLRDDERPVEVFRRLTLDDWETAFPLIDLALRETIRLKTTGCSMRKNLSGKDIPVGDTGEVIPKDAYAVYQLDHTHMDENLYKDPLKWDPARYLPDRAEDKKTQHGYLGWGSGLHQCLGMKLAKLEITVTTAMFMAQFDFRLSDKSGHPIGKLPPIDRNNLGAMKPKEAVYFKCTPRVKDF